MSISDGEENDQFHEHQQNTVHKTVQKVILSRLGLTNDDIVPVSFPKFLQIYEDFETAGIFYEEYYMYQKHIYKAYRNELDLINDKGISSAELKAYPQLFMYKNVKERKLPQNYMLFFAFLKEEFRRFNTPAVSLQSYETQLTNYYAEFELMAAKNAEVRAEAEVEQRHINNILAKEDTGETRANQIMGELIEGQLRSSKIRQEELQKKIDRAKLKIDLVDTRKLEVQLEIDDIMRERLAAENATDKILLSRKVKSLFGNFKRQIKYANAYSNKYYNEDKEERQKQAEQRRKDRLNQCLQDKIDYKTYLLKQAEVQQQEAEHNAKIKAVMEKTREAMKKKLALQHQRQNLVKMKREEEERQNSEINARIFKQEMIDKQKKIEKQIKQNRDKGLMQINKMVEKIDMERTKNEMMARSQDLNIGNASMKQTLRKNEEIDREHSKMEQIRKDDQRIKHIKYQLKSMRPGSQGYSRLADEYMRLSTKVDY